MAGLPLPEQPFTIDEQIAEVERELKMRAAVYPRWIANGNLKESTAARHVAAMRAVLETLKGLR